MTGDVQGEERYVGAARRWVRRATILYKPGGEDATPSEVKVPKRMKVPV